MSSCQVKSRGDGCSSQIKHSGSVHLLGPWTIVGITLKTDTLERWLVQLLAQLRELSQYAIIVDQIDADTQASDPFVSRFMEGRRARIEERQPFLAIDFEALLRE